MPYKTEPFEFYAQQVYMYNVCIRCGVHMYTFTLCVFGKTFTAQYSRSFENVYVHSYGKDKIIEMKIFRIRPVNRNS